jgi:hypothetical protein
VAMCASSLDSAASRGFPRGGRSQREDPGIFGGCGEGVRANGWLCARAMTLVGEAGSDALVGVAVLADEEQH